MDKDDYNLPYNRMHEVLTELSPPQFSREFDRFVRESRTLPSTTPYTGFNDLLLICMPAVLAERHDEKRMIDVLADHCTDSEYEVVEFTLACNFNDTVYILAESARRSKTPTGRKNLIHVFRRAFPGVTTGVAAERVVDTCVNWYNSQKSGLVVNLDYRSYFGISNTSDHANQNPVGVDPDFAGSPNDPHLFILKSDESPENAAGRKSLGIPEPG